MNSLASNVKEECRITKASRICFRFLPVDIREYTSHMAQSAERSSMNKEVWAKFPAQEIPKIFKKNQNSLLSRKASNNYWTGQGM